MRVHTRRSHYAATTTGPCFRFDRIHTGLATLPMAVTASSAFPGFFPPIELQAQDVGADPGQFGRLAFTDGGVYDNLGVRMFRWMERSWMAREVRLKRTTWSMRKKLGEPCWLRCKVRTTLRFAVSPKCWPWSKNEHRTARNRANP